MAKRGLLQRKNDKIFHEARVLGVEAKKGKGQTPGARGKTWE